MGRVGASFFSQEEFNSKKIKVPAQPGSAGPTAGSQAFGSVVSVSSSLRISRRAIRKESVDSAP
jgi:hypothetical protein